MKFGTGAKVKHIFESTNNYLIYFEKGRRMLGNTKIMTNFTAELKI